MINGTTVESLIVDILKTQMNLPQANIWVRNQTIQIPNDTALYTTVGFVDGKPYGANVDYTRVEVVTQLPGFPAPPFFTLQQNQKINALENIQINIQSRNNDAVTRRWEVVQALVSLYSKQQQDAQQFKILRIPKNFVNSSLAEGGSNLNKFSIVIPCLSWYLKTAILNPTTKEFYDIFPARVDDESTIGQTNGLIEFTIGPQETY
jgi:hypothetical protein